MPLGGKDKGRRSVKDQKRKMHQASPWSLYPMSLVFTSSRMVRFFGNLKFGAGGEDGGVEAKPTLLEIGAAIVELDQKMQVAMGKIREDQAGIMDHLWEDVVGDAEAVLDEHALGDLSEGLMMSLGHFYVSEIPNIQDKVVALTDLIKDHKQAARFLLSKVYSLMPPTTHMSRTGVIGPRWH